MTYKIEIAGRGAASRPCLTASSMDDVCTGISRLQADRTVVALCVYKCDGIVDIPFYQWQRTPCFSA